jgi:LacI family transcriptional regulator, galactose operon repressor
MRDVATHAGASVATVSGVLTENHPATPATRDRVPRAVHGLNFVANTHTRALRGMVTRTVAFVLNDVRGQSFAAAAQGAEAYCARMTEVAHALDAVGSRQLTTVHVPYGNWAGPPCGWRCAARSPTPSEWISTWCSAHGSWCANPWHDRVGNHAGYPG